MIKRAGISEEHGPQATVGARKHFPCVPSHAMGGSVVWIQANTWEGPSLQVDSCPRFYLHDYSLSELSLWL